MPSGPCSVCGCWRGASAWASYIKRGELFYCPEHAPRVRRSKHRSHINFARYPLPMPRRHHRGQGEPWQRNRAVELAWALRKARTQEHKAWLSDVAAWKRYRLRCLRPKRPVTKPGQVRRDMRRLIALALQGGSDGLRYYHVPGTGVAHVQAAPVLA